MFIHLHNHTTASLLDGLIPPKELAHKAKEQGFPAIAITDHGSINGAIKFYNACKEVDIKPIIGIEAYFVDDASIKEKGDKRYHIILLAKSMQGFKSICRMMTKAHKDFYYVPRIDVDSILDSEDVIVSTACSYGIATHPNFDRLIHIFKEKLKEDLYLEIMPLDFDQQKNTNQYVIDLSKKLNVKTIATNDIHYMNKNDNKIHNFLLKMNSRGRLSFDISGLYMRSEKEMLDGFIQCGVNEQIAQDALANTEEVYEKINIDIPKRPISLPHIADDPYRTLSDLLNWSDSEEGVYLRQVYEMEIIKEKGYLDYFLMVKDVIDYANEEEIELGAGRGSAGGSLTCYSLGITAVNPLKENLSFERFLNPERSDYPDIDLDFPKSKRQEIVKYLKDKYGHDRVANLSTVAELKLKSAWKDVAREFKVPFMDSNKISKLIDNDIDWDIQLNENEALKEAIGQLNDKEEIIQMVKGISGTLRQSGTHAAGVVVAPFPITNIGILERRGDDYSLNWDMGDIEHFGLVKLDVLGLRTLDIIGEAKALIKSRHGVNIVWDSIDVSEPDILHSFGEGFTTGIFQFETNTMTRLVKQLKNIPSKQTLNDCNAIARPGPMDSGLTELYIKRHRGEHAPFTEPYMKWFVDNEIAEDTYRIIIYQEQVTEALQKLAGYSIPEADIVRRTIAKKKGDMSSHEEKFLEGVERVSGMPRDIGKKLWAALETFSRYGFNRAHASAYTELALRQMYLKLHYPLEYMAALYKWTDDNDKTQRFVDECMRLGIPIYPPDVNTSGMDFQIYKDGIQIGLKAIKQVGTGAAAAIIQERKTKLFINLKDFRVRLSTRSVNKTTITNLLLAGALDSFGINKKHYLEWEDVIHEAFQGKKKIDEVAKRQAFEGLSDHSDTLSKNEEELLKASLMEGVYRLNIKPSPTMNLDETAIGKLGLIRSVIGGCQMCSLREFYDCPVAFEYNAKSKIMVVAEVPGADEVRLGRPLIGDAGDKLMEIFEEYSLTRKDLYLTNVYKCRPFRNKLPDNPPKNCWDILKKEIKVTQPKMVLALGGRVMEFFTGSSIGIQAKAEELRFTSEIIAGHTIVPVLYSVHPGSLFYQNSAANADRLRRSIEYLSEVFFGYHKEDDEDEFGE